VREKFYFTFYCKQGGLPHNHRVLVK